MDNQSVTASPEPEKTTTTSNIDTPEISTTDTAHNTKITPVSPAAFAQRHASSSTQHSTYGPADIEAAKAFGRVDEQGTVFVKDGEQEREVGQFPDGTPEEALNLYITRYLDLAAKVDLFASRVKAGSLKPHDIDQSYRQLVDELKQPQVVGDLARLRELVEKLQEEINQRKEAIAQERKAAIQATTEKFTSVVTRAQEVAANLNNTTNWRQTAQIMQDLFDEWKQIQKDQQQGARLDRATSESLWKEFSQARSTFTQARRKWLQERQTQRDASKDQKERIIAEAEELKNSTDWARTSRRFNELLNQWKSVARIGKQVDDDLWARFRQAADTFYTARQEQREQVQADESENLKKKQELLEKAEALLPVTTVEAAKVARRELANIQESWDTIGYVPRDASRSIEQRLDAVDRAIKAVEDAAWKHTDPEADARKSSFTQQIQAQLDELTAKIAMASTDAEREKLQAEKATKEQWLHAIR